MKKNQHQLIRKIKKHNNKMKTRRSKRRKKMIMMIKRALAKTARILSMTIDKSGRNSFLIRIITLNQKAFWLCY